jgi:hypothetical protein
LLHKGGLKNVVKEFIKKRKGLMVIFVLLVVVAAFAKLNDSLKIGFVVGALICFYKIYKLKSTVDGVLPKDVPAAPAAAAGKTT